MGRLDFDWQADTARRRCALEVGTVFRGLWARVGQSLTGDYGSMLQRAIERRFSPGPREEVPDVNGGTVPGRSIRWMQLAEMCEPEMNPLRMLVAERSLLYRRPVVVSGDVATDVWSWLRERSGLDEALRCKQSLVLGIGSAAVRPVLRRDNRGGYYPPTLAVLDPARCTAIPDPSDPSRAGVFVEHLERSVQVWDVRDAGAPVWGEWRTAESWSRGDRAIWEMSGADFPWWYDGEPLQPCVTERAIASASNLLDVYEGVAQAVLDKACDWARINLVEYHGIQRTLVLSGQPLDGFLQAVSDPGAIAVLSGLGDKSVTTIPDAQDAVEKMRKGFAEKVATWARQLEPGVDRAEVQGTQSGRALEIRLTGKDQIRQEAIQRATRPDEQIVKALVGTHNYLVRSGQISLRRNGSSLRYTPSLPALLSADLLIPEGTVSIAYPHVWSALEKRELMAEMMPRIDRGDESPRALYLLDHDLEDDRPDGPNWTMAGEALAANLEEASSLAARGYGMRWAERAAMAAATPEDETALYTPPGDVATTAADGLRMRDATGRGPAGMTPEGKKLLTRAKQLREQSPQGIGWVRALNNWLEVHASDSTLEQTGGAWNDAGNPSSEWITWQTQGGDDALGWTRVVLAGVAI